MLPAPHQVATRSGGGRPEPAAVLSVVVVAGTRVRQTRLRTLLEGRDLVVLGAARDLAAALAIVAEQRPQAVLFDLAPDAGGLDVIEGLMARCPLPIVLTGAAATDPSAALARGAVDVVPTTAEALGPDSYAHTLVRHLRVASRVRVITHPRGRLRERGLAADRDTGRPRTVPADTDAPAAARATVSRLPRRVPVVAIGASTGGPPALASLLAALPPDLPAAVVVVQHMADGFVSSLASWLSGVTTATVRVAEEGDRLRPGQVLLAPSDANLEIDSGLRVRLTPPRPGQLHVPEVDTTFRSVAEMCRERAVGVLLTGMGRDGAAGLLAMRTQGAYTIGQDEQTSVVWGMPAAAASIDAVTMELGLGEIAPDITQAVARLVGGAQ